jgi:hypothetical protein
MVMVRRSLCAIALVIGVACDEEQSLQDGGNAPDPADAADAAPNAPDAKDASTDPSKDASAQQQVDASKPKVDKDTGAAQETKDAGPPVKSVGHVQFQLLGVQ